MAIINATQAIQSFWVGSAAPALFSDGLLWPGEAPDKPAMPYAVLVQVSEPIETYTTAFSMPRGTYQINCHSPDLDAALTLAHAVGSIFNKAALPIQNGQALHCLAGEIRWVKGDGLGLDGADCWIAYVELDVLQTR